MHIINEILVDFQTMEYSAPGIERILSLKQGSLEIARMTDDSEIIALLKIIHTYSWLLEVAEHNFEESVSKRIMLHNAIDVLVNEKFNKKIKK